MTTKDVFSVPGCLVTWTRRAASSDGAEGIIVRWAISREERPGGGVTEAAVVC